MADTVSITDISKQLNAASRLVVVSDWFWVLAADGSSVRIPAEFVRAYLTENIKPSIGDDGTWQVSGKSTGVKASGNTPKLRGGLTGIEASYDEGKTWTQIVAYSDINVDVAALESAYKKVVDTEAARVEAENARKTAESARATAESSRVDAETARATAESNRAKAESSRVTAENKRVEAESTRSANEDARKTAETARADAETSRTNAEKTRGENESSRVTAEQERATAESTRESNEATRVSNENARIDAEKKRVAAETARMNAEKQRETDFNSAKSACEAATSNAITATENANTATTSASTAADKANGVVKTMEDNMQSNVNEVKTKANEAKDTIDGLVNGLAVTQTTGNSTTSVMSQKAVTEKIDNLNEKVQGRYVNIGLVQKENFSLVINSGSWFDASAYGGTGKLYDVSSIIGRTLRLTPVTGEKVIWSMISSTDTLTGKAVILSSGDYSNENIDVIVPDGAAWLYVANFKAWGCAFPSSINILNPRSVAFISEIPAIVDNLTDGGHARALSAEQGMIIGRDIYSQDSRVDDVHTLYKRHQLANNLSEYGPILLRKGDVVEWDVYDDLSMWNNVIIVKSPVYSSDMGIIETSANDSSSFPYTVKEDCYALLREQDKNTGLRIVRAAQNGIKKNVFAGYLADYAKSLYFTNVFERNLLTELLTYNGNGVFRFDREKGEYGIYDVDPNRPIQLKIQTAIKRSELTRLGIKHLYVYCNVASSLGCRNYGGTNVLKISVDDGMESFVQAYESNYKNGYMRFNVSALTGDTVYIRIFASTDDKTGATWLTLSELHITSHIIEDVWGSRKLVDSSDMDCLYGKDCMTWGTESEITLNEAIRRTKDYGTLTISSGDYDISVLENEKLIIYNPITIEGKGDVRFIGGHKIKEGNMYNDNTDVYSVDINTDNTGYVSFGKSQNDFMWQHDIQSDEYKISDVDQIGLYGKRKYRLPMTKVKLVGSVDAVVQSETPACYYDSTNKKLYFRAVTGSDLSKNPMIVNRKEWNINGYAGDRILEIFTRAEGITLKNLTFMYEEVFLGNAKVTLEQVKSLGATFYPPFSIGWGDKFQHIIMSNCEAGGGYEDNIDGGGYESTCNAKPKDNGYGFIEINNLWSHDAYGDGISEHGNSKWVIKDSVFENCLISGATPAGSDVTYINCLFRNNGGPGQRGGLQILPSIDSSHVTAIGCAAVDNIPYAYSILNNDIHGKGKICTLTLINCSASKTSDIGTAALFSDTDSGHTNYLITYAFRSNYKDKEKIISGGGNTVNKEG